MCDDAGDCGEEPVTSAEYVRQSGGWDFLRGVYRRGSLEGRHLPVSFMPRSDTHGLAYKEPDRTQSNLSMEKMEEKTLWQATK